MDSLNHRRRISTSLQNTWARRLPAVSALAREQQSRECVVLFRLCRGVIELELRFFHRFSRSNAINAIF